MSMIAHVTRKMHVMIGIYVSKTIRAYLSLGYMTDSCAKFACLHSVKKFSTSKLRHFCSTMTMNDAATWHLSRLIYFYKIGHYSGYM